MFCVNFLLLNTPERSNVTDVPRAPHGRQLVLNINLYKTKSVNRKALQKRAEPQLSIQHLPGEGF